MKVYIPILLLLACSEPDYGKWTNHIKAESNNTCNVTIQNVFAPEQKERISAAIETWNYAFNGNLTLEQGVESDDCQIYIYSMSRKVAIEKYNRNEKVLGFASNNNIVIIDDINDLHIFYGTLLHEFGHVFHAKHVADEESLMYAKLESDRACVDKATIIQISQYYGYELQTLNWCE
jgi:hypothetical protein